MWQSVYVVKAEGLTVGERVAWYRRRRGIPQEVLAGLVGRTGDWLSKIENGRANLDRLSVIRLLADVLEVTVGELVGELQVPHKYANARSQPIPLIREALLDYHQLSLASDSASEITPSQDGVRRSLNQAWDAYQESRYEIVIGALPALIKNVHSLTRAETVENRAKAHGYFALTYQLTAVLLTKLGEADLAWIAAERGFNAAQHTANPAVIGSLFRSIVHTLLSMERFTEAKKLTTKGADYLQPELRSASPQLLSAYGTLFLTGSVAAARDDDRQTAKSYLSEAAESARRLGKDENYLWTAFGPTNVAIHRVTTAVDLGDIQVATDLAPHIDTSNLPIERRVRHVMEIARAYSAWNQADAAMAALLDAEQLAPEQVGRHAISRQLVHTWIRREKGKPSFRLADLADRIHALG
ncbi:MAG: helix-turn-helix domain-containing protein [Mycobacteriales bacterium]